LVEIHINYIRLVKGRREKNGNKKGKKFVTTKFKKKRWGKVQAEGEMNWDTSLLDLSATVHLQETDILRRC
jgi:hypothetical protein